MGTRGALGRGMRKTTGRIARGLVLSVAVLIILATVGAGSAQATDQLTGNPGSLTVYPVLGRTGDVIQAQTPFAWRSPGSSGAQRVYVRYFLYRHDGTLLTPNNPPWIYRPIPSTAQGVWLPAASWDVTASKFPGWTGFYVTMEVQWDTGTGQYLGTREFIYDRAGDYRCVDHAGYYCLDGDSIWFLR